MLIKSGGFPLLKLSIAKNEYLPGYMANQLLYGARGHAKISFTDHTSDIRKLSWRLIENTQGLVERSDLSLPSLHECIMGHTLYPYFSWCLSKSDANKLYAQYAYPIESLAIERTRGRSRGEILGTYRKTRRGLTWCQQCASSQLTGINSRPFPIWHRLHFAPNILVCHLHKVPLSTFCDECIDKTGMERSNWIPTLECLCSKGLKERAQMTEKMRLAMSDITFKANELVEGKISADFTPHTIKEAIKKQFAGRGKGRTLSSDILDAVSECIGEEAAELLEFNEHTVKAFIIGKGAPNHGNPIHILAFGYAAFNGFDGLTETINGSTKWIPNHSSHPSKKPSTRKTRFPPMLVKAEFKDIVAKMTIKERNELRGNGRAWLLEKLKTHPHLTRSEFWARHQYPAYKVYYLVWIDTDWYQMQIPTVSDRQSKARLMVGYGALSKITVAMIYERCAIALKEAPLKTIYQTSLMWPLDKANIRSVKLHSPEIREALRNCVDKGNAWQLRGAQAISQMISEFNPDHHYADASWYSDVDKKEFRARLRKAKKWLLDLKKPH